MRQVGSFQDNSDANRFAAHLVTLGVIAHSVQEADSWEVWIREEDHVELARHELTTYEKNPHAEIYRDAEQRADEFRQERARQLILQYKQQQQQYNQQRSEVATREGATREGQDQRTESPRIWQPGSLRKAPLMIVLIGASLMATMWTRFGTERENLGKLSFCGFEHLVDPNWQPLAEDTLIDIRAGQLWRLVTPVFPQEGVFQLLFNIYWIFTLGVLLEDRQGTSRVALLVLAAAISSNLAQAWLEWPYFTGLSGVVFALFGYAWMKSSYDPAAGIFITQRTVMIFLIWFMICLVSSMGSVSNTAHGVGLSVGVAAGYGSIFFRSSTEDERQT